MKTPQIMRIPIRLKPALLLATTATLTLATAVGAQAATPPVKEILESHIGAKVNATNGTNICTVPSGNTCQAGEISSAAGGFYFPEAVAATSSGDVYVLDNINHRVQEFDADGTFIRMFGREVNETAHLKGEPANEDICPVNTGDKCKAGVEGDAAAQFAQSKSIAVDPVTDDVYVGEDVLDTQVSPTVYGGRVQKFGPEGRFILEIGMEVNGTTKGNVCTQEEIEKEKVKCVAPALHTLEDGKSSEPFMGLTPSVTVGGPEDLLYVGDEGRVQEFETDGEYKRSVSLASISAQQNFAVQAIAVDDSCSLHVPVLTESTSPTCKEFDADYGDLYFTYSNERGINSTVYKLDQAGGEVTEFFPLTLTPRLTNTGQFEFLDVPVDGLAVGPSGTLAVSEQEDIEPEDSGDVTSEEFVSLLDGATGHLISESLIGTESSYANGLAFDGNNELFAVTGSQEMLAYRPVPVGELVTKPEKCTVEGEHETSVTVSCSLKGEVNPFGIGQTEVWFGWGSTCGLGSRTSVTALAPVSVAEGVSAPLSGLIPNQGYCYQLAGEDEHVKAPEQLTGERVSFTTASVPPRIVGEVGLATVGPFAATLFGEVNPENANTSYAFQYGQCEDLDDCPAALETNASSSAAYGAIGAELEARGLQPATVYHYRLVAASPGGKAHGATATFTTAPAPVLEAETGAVDAITATGAVVSGTVDPDGEAAVYTFELGVDEGAATQYGTVFSGSAGAGATPVEQSLALTGLQPGTSYAYRISARTGTGATADSTATGATHTFTTAGLPAVLALPVPLAQLAIPAIAFPTAVVSGTAPRGLTVAQKLAKALTACKRQKSKKQRTACEKQARKKYAKSKQATNRKKG